MKTSIILLFAAFVILLSCEKDNIDDIPPDNNEPGGVIDTTFCTVVTKMISNGALYDTLCNGFDMGQITAVRNSGFITVTYDVAFLGWLIQETQLYIGPETDIPQTSGNPSPGQFPYKADHLPGVTTYTYGPFSIPDSTYVIAAHADVHYELNTQSVDSLCEYLPDYADFICTAKGQGSYLDITVSNGFWLDGSYDAWCMDLDNSIVLDNLFHNANVYCSYESLPVGLVVHPENLDLINWIINNITVGMPSSCGGDYTWGDIQRAFWELIDDDNTYIGLGDWSQCRADEIVASATANGEDYEPSCDDLLGVLLDAGEDVQTVLITIPFPCNIQFTGGAWGYGHYDGYCDQGGAEGISFTDSKYYGGNQWGWYFYGCE